MENNKTRRYSPEEILKESGDLTLIHHHGNDYVVHIWEAKFEIPTHIKKNILSNVKGKKMCWRYFHADSNKAIEQTCDELKRKLWYIITHDFAC